MHRPAVFIQDVWKPRSIEKNKIIIDDLNIKLLFRQPQCL